MEKTKEPKKLTPRQWWLYRFLTSRSKEWHSEQEICFQCNFDPEYHGQNYKKNWRNEKGSKCPAIWEDMKAINLSYEVDKVIITKGRMFKAASSKKEAETEYVDAMKRRAIRALMCYGAIKRKIKADGQGKLVSLAGVQIDDESRAKRFIETFADEEE